MCPLTSICSVFSGQEGRGALQIALCYVLQKEIDLFLLIEHFETGAVSRLSFKVDRCLILLRRLWRLMRCSRQTGTNMTPGKEGNVRFWQQEHESATNGEFHLSHIKVVKGFVNCNLQVYTAISLLFELLFTVVQFWSSAVQHSTWGVIKDSAVAV